MSTADDLLAEIKATLPTTIQPSLTSTSALSDLFEAYLFSIIVEAAQEEDAQVHYRNIDGAIPSTFTFRTSPGRIYSDTHPYTYAVLDFDTKPLLEVHLGIQVSGKSGVLHECDVAVLGHDEAETCRQNRVSPRSHKLIIAAECKHYADNLALGLARSFRGLSADLSTTECYFVSNIGSRSVEQYLTRRAQKWGHGIRPSASREVERLRNAFQQAFVHYKAVT